MRGWGLYPKDLSEVNKMQQSKPDVPYSRRSGWNVATVAANECMSSAKGKEVNELMVVEIKKFVWPKLTSRTTSYLQQVRAGSVCECRIRISTSLVELTITQTRMFEEGSASRCRVHIWPYSGSFRPTIHPPIPLHCLWRSILNHVPRRSSTYGANAPPRPAQRAPLTLSLLDRIPCVSNHP